MPPPPPQPRQKQVRFAIQQEEKAQLRLDRCEDRQVHLRSIAQEMLELLIDRWRHLVRDVNEHVRSAVYVGRSTFDGQPSHMQGELVSFGNPERTRFSKAQERGASLQELTDEWQRCVDVYTRRTLSSEGQALRDRIREELPGRELACHCVRKRLPRRQVSLPCHATIMAVIANCEESDLQVLAWLGRGRQTTTSSVFRARERLAKLQASQPPPLPPLPESL